MIPLARWLDRSFPERPPVDVFPAIVDRLRGTAARIEQKVEGVPEEALVRRVGTDWSAQEHIGHLLDLESLWTRRIDELLTGRSELAAADMSNRRTYEANHNNSRIGDLVLEFRSTRNGIIQTLDGLSEEQVAATALHPRLRQPMRLIDLCHFVAEHDDHHLAIIHELLRGV